MVKKILVHNLAALRGVRMIVLLVITTISKFSVWMLAKKGHIICSSQNLL